jgi:hypothetical protein
VDSRADRRAPHGHGDHERSRWTARRAWIITGFQIGTAPVLLLFSDITGVGRTWAPWLLTVALFDVTRHLWRWRRFVAIFGWPSAEQLRTMRRTEELRAHHIGSERRPDRPYSFVTTVVSIAVLALLGLLVWAWTRWLILLYLSLWTLAVAVKYFIRRSRPPVVLMLGASGPQASALLEQLLHITDPFPVANSLRYEHSSKDIAEAVAFHSYRTPDAIWEKSVGNLVDCAQLVVLDLREATTPLAFELNLVTSRIGRDRLHIVGPPAPTLPIGDHKWISAGEARERVRRRLRGDYTKTAHLQRSRYSDRQNGYFTIRRPKGWRASVERDVRSKVTFRHPDRLGVSLNVLARIVSSREPSIETIDYGPLPEWFPNASFEQRRIVSNGLTGAECETHDETGLGHGLVRMLDHKGLRVTLTFSAPTLTLYTDFLGIAVESMETIELIAPEEDEAARLRHFVSNQIRQAQLTAEQRGVFEALELLRRAQTECPESPELQAEIKRLQQILRT